MKMETNQLPSIGNTRKNKARLIRFGAIAMVMVCMMSSFTATAFAAGTTNASEMLSKLQGVVQGWINPLMGVGAGAAALAFIGVSIAKLLTASQQATDRYSQWQKRILIALVCIIGVQFIFNFVLGIVNEVSGESFSIPEGTF